MDNKSRPIPNSAGPTAADNQRRALQSVVQSHKDSSSDDGTPVQGDVQTCTHQCLEMICRSRGGCAWTKTAAANCWGECERLTVCQTTRSAHPGRGVGFLPEHSYLKPRSVLCALGQGRGGRDSFSATWSRSSILGAKQYYQYYWSHC